MSNHAFSRFVGGSPGMVVLRLIAVSFVVGIVLDSFGLDPASLFDEVVGALRRIVEFGVGDVGRIGRVLATGAMVVVPVWLVLRLLDAGRTR